MALAAVLAAVALLSGCGRGRHRVLDVAYVSAPQAALRDQIAAIYNRVGNVKNGERVEVLEPREAVRPGPHGHRDGRLD